MRRVGVAAVDLAGHDHVDGRLLHLHRADLDRRRVRAQDHLVAHVEGVLHRPGRVIWRHVQRGEVVVVVLDLRALRDAEAKPEEDVLDLPPRLRDQVKVPERRRRVARQRHVDAVAGEPGVELGGLEGRGPLAQE